MYQVIKSKEDSTALQRDFDALFKCKGTWSMKFHPSKCNDIKITNEKKIIRFAYKIHNKCLEKVERTKYLGVHINKKLLWKYHIFSITFNPNNYRHFLK